MNSRERVLASAAHEPTDRLPIFGPNIMRTAEPYDPELMRYLEGRGFDEWAVLPSLTPAPDEKRELGGDESVDAYGCRFKWMGVGSPYCTHSPLEGAESVAEVEAHDWPDPEAPGLVAADAAERARAMRAEGVRATAIGVPPLFHQYHYLRGFEQWMVDIKLNRDIHRAIADRIHHVNCVTTMRLLEQVGPWCDFVATGDDLGTSTSSYMSPADFRELVKPYYKDLIGRIKGRWPHIRFYMHSHGQIMDLVGDLIECGVDILNPVLPLDNMDAARLKREYGRELCFHGGVDIERIVPFGTVEEVRRHVREVIQTLGAGGGFWLKLQVISPVIPPENIIAAYETAFEVG